MHLQLLKNEKWLWYVEEVGKPLFTVLAIVAIGRMFIGDEIKSIPKILALFSILAMSFIGAVLCSPILRRKLMERINTNTWIA